jgi:hypothetical protein
MKLSKVAEYLRLDVRTVKKMVKRLGLRAIKQKRLSGAGGMWYWDLPQEEFDKMIRGFREDGDDKKEEKKSKESV